MLKNKARHDFIDYQNSLLIANYVKRNLINRKEPSVLVYKDISILNNMLFDQVILPSKETFRATFKNDNNNAKINLHNDLGSGILHYLILPKNKPLEKIRIIGYPLKNFELKKTIENSSIYAPKLPITQ